MTLHAKKKRIENPHCPNCVKKFHLSNVSSKHGKLPEIGNFFSPGNKDCLLYYICYFTSKIKKTTWELTRIKCMLSRNSKRTRWLIFQKQQHEQQLFYAARYFLNFVDKLSLSSDSAEELSWTLYLLIFYDILGFIFLAARGTSRSDNVNESVCSNFISFLQLELKQNTKIPLNHHHPPTTKNFKKGLCKVLGNK